MSELHGGFTFSGDWGLTHGLIYVIALYILWFKNPSITAIISSGFSRWLYNSAGVSKLIPCQVDSF